MGYMGWERQQGLKDLSLKDYLDAPESAEHAGVLGMEAVELSVKDSSFKKPLSLVKCNLTIAHTSEDHSQWQHIGHKVKNYMRVKDW